MSIAINGMDGNPATIRDIDSSGQWYCYGSFRLAFSNSYSTGGDTLDLTAVANLFPSGTLVYAFIDGNGTGTQQSASGGYYVVIGNQGAGTALNAFKVKIFAAAGTELAAGAYPAAVTGDYVVLSTQWRKLGS